MTDVTPETKTAVLRSLCSQHGLSEDALEREWTKWVALPRQNDTAGASVADVKSWFSKHLAAVGLVGRSPSPDGTGTTKSKAGRAAADLDPLTDGAEAFELEAPVDDDDDAADHDAWYAALIGDSAELLEGGDQDAEEAEMARIIREEVRAVTASVKAKNAGKKLDAGLGEEDLLDDAVFERAEKHVMDALHAEASASSIFAQDDDDEALEPIGSHGTRSRKTRGSIYKGVKLLAEWALRHVGTNYDPEKASATGRVWGEDIAMDIVAMDKRGRKTPSTRKKRRESFNFQNRRHDTVILLLLEGIDAAGRATTGAAAHKAEEMKDIQEYLAPYVQSLDANAEFLNSGESATDYIRRKAHRYGKGLARKYRAEANVRDLREGRKTLVYLADLGARLKTVALMPGKREDQRRQDMLAAFGRVIAKKLKRETTAAEMFIKLFGGAFFGFLTHPDLEDHREHMARTALDKIGKELGAVPKTRAEDLAFKPDPDTESGERPLPAVPVGAKKLAGMLFKRAQAHLERNPSLRKRAGDRYALMVPADEQCLVKVLGSIQSSEEAAERYVRGALLGRHPNRRLDGSGHLISLSGTVFHLSLPTKAGARALHANDSKARTNLTRLVQMRRPGGTADDRWDAETRNAGGKLEAHPDRLAMHCAAAQPIAAGKGLVMQALYYWPTN